MAHIAKRIGKKGISYRAQIELKGVTRSATFESAGAAKQWAAEQEIEIRNGVRGEIPNKKTFSDLLDRYLNEVSAKKRGHAKESLRIAFLKRSRIAAVSLRAFGKTHVSDHLTERSRAVSKRGKLMKSGSVKRELNLISHICTMAVDWGWMKSNPCKEIKQKPKDGKSRTRLMLDAEWPLLVAAAQTEYEKRVIQAADFALETGMRSGEICALHKQHIKDTIAIVVMSKNGEAREVPLSTKAQGIVAPLLDTMGPIFGLTDGTRDLLWRKIRDRAGLAGLNFHDLRHTSATRWSKVLNPYQLCRMFGWKNLNQAMTYYNEKASDVAKLLQTPTDHDESKIGSTPAQVGQGKPQLSIVKVA